MHYSDTEHHVVKIINDDLGSTFTALSNVTHEVDILSYLITPYSSNVTVNLPLIAYVFFVSFSPTSHV